MVNEKRLLSMIKMAEFDTNDGKSCKPMIQYARKDYVAFHMLGSFVTGTAAFLLGALLWILYAMEKLMEQTDMEQFGRNLMLFGAVYAGFMVLYLAASYIVFQVRYTNGRKKVKQYHNSLKRINAIYTREERLKPGQERMESSSGRQK